MPYTWPILINITKVAGTLRTQRDADADADAGAGDAGAGADADTYADADASASLVAGLEASRLLMDTTPAPQPAFLFSPRSNLDPSCYPTVPPQQTARSSKVQRGKGLSTLHMCIRPGFCL